MSVFYDPYGNRKYLTAILVADFQIDAIIETSCSGAFLADVRIPSANSLDMT
jgi:hypothetical protein